ncbi:MAG: hypothetical protein AAFP86_01610 [Planctomycetota bacterium]
MIRTLLLAVLPPLVAPAVFAQADPFAAGERWSAAPAALDWTPEEVVFAGDDGFVWTGLRGSDDSLALYDAVASGPASPRGVVPRHIYEWGTARVAAGRRGDRVFALRLLDLPATGAARRRPIVYAFDPLAATGGADLSPVWARDLGLDVNANALLAADAAGDTVVSATWDDATATVHVRRFDGTTGDVLADRTFAGLGLDALAVSDDGTRIALTAALELHVLGTDLQTVHASALASSTRALAVSADGSVVAHGRLGGLTVLSDLGGFGYGVSFDQPAGAPEVPSALDLSADGTLIAVAWWNYANGRAARLELVDLLFGLPLASESVPPAAGGLQNLPVAAQLSNDGRRAAFALWGNGADDEVRVLEAGAFGPVLTIDTDGSARSLAFDATGTRIAVAAKSVHAQVFGADGELLLYDTGERELHLTSTPRVGGNIEASARFAGATSGWFLAGPLAQSPLLFPGSTNPLLLERGSIRVVPAAADASGRIDLVLPVPQNPALVGLQIHLQAAFPIPAGLEFSPGVLSPFLMP